VLSVRPAPAPDSAPGRIRLDVVVTGRQGTPVPDLKKEDFTLTDNKQPRKIVDFELVDGSGAKAGQPAEVILLIDTVNATFQQVAVAREQIAKFLRQNGGHLAQPVRIFLLTGEGLRMQPRPSVDGNALLEVLNQVEPSVRTTGSAASGMSEVERFQFSLRTLTGIAINEAPSNRTAQRGTEDEARKKNRKTLIWIGPGWPTLTGPNYSTSAKEQQHYFDAIVQLSTVLREARIALYSVSPFNPAKGAAARPPESTPFAMASAEAPPASRVSRGADDAGNESSYREFLRGVKSARQADSGNLALQVLAVESGGRVLDPSNDLAGQIVNCVADASVYYTLSFDPPKAERADEYHELKVQAGRPDLTARTSAGYYNQP
jgi:VWFA-related protein